MSHPTDDTNTSRSRHAPTVAGKPVVVTPVGSTNSLEFRGDYGCWDTVAGKFVLVDQTQVGTTILPKL